MDKQRLKTPFELFGIECKKGWINLYQPLIDLCNLYGYEILQVKEKFGGLRFYYQMKEGGLDLEDLVECAEAASFHICEGCGYSEQTGWDWEKKQPIEKINPRNLGGWIRTLCDECAKPYLKNEINRTGSGSEPQASGNDSPKR